MDRKDDIDFLGRFRGKIDKYLFLGYAPPENPTSHPEALARMHSALALPDFQDLRREINEMKPRAKQLLAQCNISPTFDERSTSNSVLDIMGIPTFKTFHMLDLITENRSRAKIEKSAVFDAIDQAIGVLKHQPATINATIEPKLFLVQDYVFISHSSQDSELVSAIKQAFVDLDVEPNFFEDKSPGGAPTKEIARAVSGAKALFVFFTFNSLSSDTRDWIVFEFGVAVAHDVPVHAWKLKGLPKDSLPRLVEQVTTYHDFDPSTHGILALTKEVRNTAKSLPKVR